MKIIVDNRLIRVPQGIGQKLGRFYLTRRSYSVIKNTIQAFDKNISHKKRELMSKPSLFAGFCVEDAIETIHKKSVAFGLKLPSNKTENIHDFAIDNFCFEPDRTEQFKINEVKNSCLNSRRVFRALVTNLDNCKAIRKIIADPILLRLACDCLGYYPSRVTPHLTWSIASKHPVEEIKPYYPPTNFHYDTAGYNFVTAYFYITDVDRESGPHVMICNTHRSKPFPLLFSGRHSDEKIYHHYGRKNELVVTGKAGFGFFQDPSCIHKVIPPITQNRLLLQIRYS